MLGGKRNEAVLTRVEIRTGCYQQCADLLTSKNMAKASSNFEVIARFRYGDVLTDL